MTLPVGAATATITVGAAMAHDGTAGTLVSLQVWPEVPAGLVWAATGDMIEPWAAVGTAGTLTILADQPGVVTSGTVDGTPALVAIAGWPLVATWVTRQGTGAPTKHARRFAAPEPGAVVDLDMLPASGALPPAAITYAQSLDFSTDMVAELSIGTVTTGAAGTSASAALTPDGDAYTLDLTTPRGDQGDKGDQGDAGPTGTAATVVVGTTTTGAAGSSASVTNSGTPAAAVLNFTVPQGIKGDPGNPTAYELRGTGMPNGVVAAPPGTYYTDTAGTNGAWRWLKKTGTGNTGWSVVHGDTGPRSVPLSSAGAAAYPTMTVVVQRINSSVTVTVRETASSSPVVGWTRVYELPIGFRAAQGAQLPLIDRLNGAPAAGILAIDSASPFALVFVKKQDASTCFQSITTPAALAWPTTLPGDPA